MPTLDLPAWAHPYSFTEWSAGTPHAHLGKCPQCKRIARILITQYKRLTEKRTMFDSQLTFEYRYEAPAGCSEYRSGGTTAFTMQCTHCTPTTRQSRPSMTLKRVDGHYHAGRKCDIRCTSATGTTCECQCGGRNHGADHGT